MADALKDAPEMAGWLREEAPHAIMFATANTARQAEARKALLDRCATTAEMLDALCQHATDMTEALRLALPVMRRTAAEYLDSVMVRSDPATIAPAEWEEIAPDLDAIAAAEACVGRVTEPSWLDAIIDAGKWRDPGRPVPHHGSGGGELR